MFPVVAVVVVVVGRLWTSAGTRDAGVHPSIASRAFAAFTQQLRQRFRYGQ